jgi:hypothetical protein
MGFIAMVLDRGPILADRGHVEKTAKNERYPRSRLDKLGIKPDAKVTLDGVKDAQFEAELATRTKDVSKRARKNAAVIIYEIATVTALGKLEKLKSQIADDGMIWVLWKKGRKELTETHVREAALSVGLVDVKVMAFSDELSGLKLVIPLASRKQR